MIGSTEEFLTILRSGNYIWAIVEWKNFCTQKYQEFNGDTLHLLMLYELINHKYQTNDFDHVLNLCILCQQIGDLPDGFLFMVTYFRAAATLYDIYHKHNVLPFFTLPNTFILTKDKILDLMNQPLPQLNDEKLNELLSESDEAIDKAIPLLKLEPARQMQLKRQRMNFLKNIADRYFTLLCTYYSEDDATNDQTYENGKMRKSLVDALVLFLDSSLDTPWTREKIKEYIESINKYKPEKWEKDYLNQLYAPSYASRLACFFKETIMSWADTPTNTPTC